MYNVYVKAKTNVFFFFYITTYHITQNRGDLNNQIEINNQH